MLPIFDSDQRKAKPNLRKHGVTFDEASSVFKDPLAAIFPDEEHSRGEVREIIIGHSTMGRLLLVCFTEKSGNTVRILSARPATKREQHDYEQNFQS